MRSSLIATVLGLLLSLASSGEVLTYPAPGGEKLSADYQVQADGKKVDVYSARTLDAPFAGMDRGLSVHWLLYHAVFCP